jgi:4-hydroxy-2-oxoheptanedioate aldolase
MSTLRELWDSGKPTLGGWCHIPSTWSAEVMGRAGFDWICVDTQHGLIGYDNMLLVLQALSITGTPSFVRVPWNEPADIMKALDAGAQGVIVPMVNSPEEARKAAGACRYVPDGYRSWGPTRASTLAPGFGTESANRSVICAVMVETRDAIDRVDEIVAVPGVDAVFVGPNDLAVSGGMAPSYDAREPEHRKMIDTVLAACQRRGIVGGIYCGSPEMVKTWTDAGFRMLAVTADTVLLRSAATNMLQTIRG